MTDGTAPEPAARLSRLFDDLELSYLVVVAAELGLADLLASGPRTTTDLAEATGTDPVALHRVLRTLASHGLFHQDDDQRFSLTPSAEPLRQDSPHSVRARAILEGTEAWRRTWGTLSYSVRTGKRAFDHVYGKPFFDHLVEDPELARAFRDWGTAISSSDGDAIAESHDFSAYRSVVDVGGGHGALLSAILDHHPRTEGVLFDRLDVVETAHGAVDRHIAAGRATKVPGDFFEAVPPGHDAYLMKSIIHDWDDETAVQILTNCRTAAGAAGKVLLIEIVLSDHPTDTDPTLLDISMLLFAGGRERTEAEYRTLLQRAGLTLVGVRPTGSAFSLVEAVPET